MFVKMGKLTEVLKPRTKFPQKLIVINHNNITWKKTNQCHCIFSDPHLLGGLSTWTGTVPLCRCQAPPMEQTTLLTSIIHGLCSLYGERGVLGPVIAK